MNKSLGQHFLVDKKVIKKIIASLAIRPDDIIIEIGAGHGELTKEIAKKCYQILAIEKDKKMAAKLEALKLKNTQIIQNDALKVLPQLIGSLKSKSHKMVGNIPYYITGRLFRLLSEIKEEERPVLCVFMLQKEVAERICAKPPKMNRLAAIIQFWAKPEIIAFVSSASFKPKPKVESAILKLTVNQKCATQSEKYYQIVKVLFQQPRKTILNNFLLAAKACKIVNSKEKIVKNLEKLAIDFNQRPQILSVEQIISLAKNFEN